MIEKQVRRERINTGVDLRRLRLLRSKRLLLDNRCNFGRIRLAPQYPPIAMRVRWYGGKNRHRRKLREMKVAHLRDCLRPDHRRIAGEHQQRLIALHLLARALDRMSSSALLGLQYKLDAGIEIG